MVGNWFFFVKKWGAFGTHQAVLHIVCMHVEQVGRTNLHHKANQSVVHWHCGQTPETLKNVREHMTRAMYQAHCAAKRINDGHHLPPLPPHPTKYTPVHLSRQQPWTASCMILT